MNKYKKWALGVLSLTAAALALLGALTAVIDPLFHYHKPLQGLSYYIWDERYQNDGIVKHFDYDAIITGTSMTENFRTSELDALFGVNSVKVPFSGATYKEISDNLRRAFAANDHVKMVVRGLDIDMLRQDKDLMRTDASYPDYLYDRNPFNDVSYVLNKEILLLYTVRTLQQTYYGNETTSFDEYASWWENKTFGPEEVLKGFSVPSGPMPQNSMSQEELILTRENVAANLVEIARENPDVVFYYFFPPYSGVYWCNLYYKGTLEKEIQALTTATEELLECGNIRLFSFTTEFAMTTDLNNYKDTTHYSQKINSRILQDMYAGKNMLTRENYKDHWQQVQDFYMTLDYEAYLRDWGYSFEGSES